MLNVGLIGFGLGGATFHAPFISRTQGLRLSAIVTGNEERRRAASVEYPDAVILPDAAALLAESPDIIVISTPNATHYPLAREAINAGAHVVVDKPFSVSSADARALAQFAGAKGRFAIPFQNRRWDGDFLTLKALIAAGTLGRVSRFESRFDRWRMIPKPGWQLHDAAERGESILHDLHTHLIDQALVLFGPATHVYAELRRVRPETTVADDAFVALTHASGVESHLTASIAAGQAGPRYHAMGSHAAYVKHGVDIQEETLRAGMRPGAPAYGDEPRERWGTVGAGAQVTEVPTLRGDYSPFYAGVAAAVLDGAPLPVDVERVINGLEIVEAAFRSSEQKEVIALEPA